MAKGFEEMATMHKEFLLRVECSFISVEGTCVFFTKEMYLITWLP